MWDDMIQLNTENVGSDANTNDQDIIDRGLKAVSKTNETSSI